MLFFVAKFIHYPNTFLFHLLHLALVFLANYRSQKLLCFEVTLTYRKHRIEFEIDINNICYLLICISLMPIAGCCSMK